MELIECEFCGNKLKNSKSLIYHKKNSKKCLIIQNNENILHKCNYCMKSFSINNLAKHYKICKSKIKKDTEDEHINILKKEVIDLNNEILILKNELNIYKKLYEENKNIVVDIAKEPKKQTNVSNVSNNYFNFFDEPDKVKDIINNNLTIEHIIDGQKGVAEFAYNHLIKDTDGNVNYYCSDPSRSVFKFVKKNGIVEKDVKAMKLTKLILNGELKNHTINKTVEFWTNEDGSQDNDKFSLHSENAQEIVNIEEDNSLFRNHLASLTSK